MKSHVISFLKSTRKWLARLAISYMLGIASAIDQDTKSIDDTSFKIEQTVHDRKG
jgi:hypothetical protein